MPVRLEVFNVLGQRIAILVDGERSGGFHTARWDGTNEAGQAVAAGIYLYRLSGDGVQMTRSMALIDGQAGIPAVSAGGLPMGETEAPQATSVYGLTVSGPGLIPFVDPAFRVEDGGMVNIVVEASAGLARAKTALSCGVSGDVDANKRVDIFDALYVALYSGDTSTVMPNNGDISQGDVNADGQINFTDAYLIASWLTDSSDPMLPAGIGETVCSDRAALVTLYKATNGANWKNKANWLSDQPLNEWSGVTADSTGRVISLILDENALSGALPESLGSLTNLQTLRLSGNALSGGLPESLGDLTNLQRLDLGDNQLSGSLPSELVNLTNLEDLDLSDTQLCAPTDAGFQTWLKGIETRVGVVNCGLSSIVKLTQNANLDNHPAYSPDGRKIAFVSTRDHGSSLYVNYEIYVMNADGSNPVRLTNNSVYDDRPDWSPDSSKVVFSSTRDNSGGEIYVMNANGSNPVRLTKNSVQAYAPVSSPDGSKIAFTSNTRSGGGGEIYVMDADGSNPRNLTKNGDDYFEAYPAWSPDGTKIAFYSNGRVYEIHVMDADGSNRVTLRSTGQVFDLSWSPDGTKIAFVARSNIYVMDADGSNLVQLTESNDIGLFGIDWSPDGSKLVFISNRDGDDDIYVAEYRD